MAELIWLSALLTASTILVAGFAKALRLSQFRTTVAALALFPEWLAWPLTVLLPAAEISLAAAVLAHWHIGLTAPLLALLPALFIAVLVVFRGRGGKHIACNCFGRDGGPVSVATLLFRNVLLLVVALPLLYHPDAARAPGSAAGWMLSMFTVAALLLSWVMAAHLGQALRVIRAYSEIGRAGRR